MTTIAVDSINFLKFQYLSDHPSSILFMICNYCGEYKKIRILNSEKYIICLLMLSIVDCRCCCKLVSLWIKYNTISLRFLLYIIQCSFGFQCVLLSTICFSKYIGQCHQMGRTIPSFRIASAMEEEEWKPFRKCLDKSDRRAFDRMFSIAHLYNSACSYSSNPIRIQPIFMSIIFHHYKQLIRLSDQVGKKID